MNAKIKRQLYSVAMQESGFQYSFGSNLHLGFPRGMRNIMISRICPRRGLAADNPFVISNKICNSGWSR